MKRILQFTSVLLLISTVYSITPSVWVSNTTHTLPKGRKEIGLFQPFRYGYSDKVEWETHPVLDLLIPNVNVKISRSPFAGWDRATRYSFVYPTFLLRALQKKGTGGIIAPDPDISDIPHMISIGNEIVLSRYIADRFWFTWKAGFTVAFKSGKLDERTTVDLPIVFPRLGVFYSGYLLNIGADLNGKLAEKMNYLCDVDVILIPGWEENKFFEHKAMVFWDNSDYFRLSLGYKLVYGEYPFGSQLHLLPLFDLQWGW